MTSHALDLFTETSPRKRQRAPGRARTQGTHRRRRARDVAPPTAAQRLRQFWDRHAVKTGLVGFYAWFAVANWSHIQPLLG